MRLLVMIGLLAICAANPAFAQTAPDHWETEIDTQRQITTAGVRYRNGYGLAVQCRAGSLSMILFTVPSTGIETSAGYRRLRTGVGSDLLSNYWQITGNGTAAIRNGYARGVRQLRAGGRFTVKSDAQEPETNQDIVFTLPNDPSGIDQVLQACGRPTIDPRDELRDVSEHVRLNINHPGLRIDSRRLGSMAYEYSCIVADDERVRDCVVETETPSGRGLSERLLRSAPTARFDFSEAPDNIIGGIFYISISSITRREAAWPSVR